MGDDIKRKKIAKAKRDQAKGKISKDADFEKMFGKDIDEFLEDSEWDIESVDKMSQFSKGSKNTFRSSQAGRLKLKCRETRLACLRRVTRRRARSSETWTSRTL